MATKKAQTAKNIKTAVKAVAKKVIDKVSSKKKEVKKIVESAKKKVAVKANAKKTTTKTIVAKKTVAKKTVEKKASAKPIKKQAKSTSVKSVAKPKTKSVQKSVEKTATLAQSFAPEYLVLMQKDPNWMQAFWEVSEKRIEKAKKGKCKLVIRLFDITKDLTIKRKKKQKFHDVVVPSDARSWYVENKASKDCVAVLGVAEGKKFMPLVESSPMQTLSIENANIDTNDLFVRASLGGAVLGGFGSSGLSSMSAKNWLESLSSSSGSMFSGALSSAALKSHKIDLPKDSVNYGKDFFLWVKTRLIVYGGTRPDAHLQVRGEPFPLNPDGTFSFEEDLPDSTKVIPVFATDKDGDFPTTIVPIVVKRTE